MPTPPEIAADHKKVSVAHPPSHASNTVSPNTVSLTNQPSNAPHHPPREKAGRRLTTQAQNLFRNSLAVSRMMLRRVRPAKLSSTSGPRLALALALQPGDIGGEGLFGQANNALISRNPLPINDIQVIANAVTATFSISYWQATIYSSTLHNVYCASVDPAGWTDPSSERVLRGLT